MLQPILGLEEPTPGSGLFPKRFLLCECQQVMILVHLHISAAVDESDAQNCMRDSRPFTDKSKQVLVPFGHMLFLTCPSQNPNSQLKHSSSGVYM